MDNGTLASFNSRQSSGSGGKHFHKRSVCLSGHLQNEEMPLTSYKASCLESLWMEEGIYICPFTNLLCSWKKELLYNSPSVGRWSGLSCKITYKFQDTIGDVKYFTYIIFCFFGYTRWHVGQTWDGTQAPWKHGVLTAGPRGKSP